MKLSASGVFVAVIVTMISLQIGCSASPGSQIPVSHSASVSADASAPGLVVGVMTEIPWAATPEVGPVTSDTSLVTSEVSLAASKTPSTMSAIEGIEPATEIVRPAAVPPVPATAGSTSEFDRRAKLVRLTELQGMRGMISQQEEVARGQFARQLSGILEELKAQNGFSDDDPRWGALLEAARELMTALGGAISADGAIDKWIELYGAGLGDSDIDRILEFYESPAGKKDVEAASGALPRWTEFMMNESQRVVENGIDRFMKEVEKAMGK